MERVSGGASALKVHVCGEGREISGCSVVRVEAVQPTPCRALRLRWPFRAGARFPEGSRSLGGQFLSQGCSQQGPTAKDCAVTSDTSIWGTGLSALKVWGVGHRAHCNRLIYGMLSVNQRS